MSSLPNEDSQKQKLSERQGHDLLDLELSGHGFKRAPSTKIGFPVALVAVASVIGVVIIIILFGFRWRQNRRMRQDFIEMYHVMENHLPPPTIFQPNLEMERNFDISPSSSSFVRDDHVLCTTSQNDSKLAISNSLVEFY